MADTRRRKHAGTYADSLWSNRDGLVLKVYGNPGPADLVVQEPGDGCVLAGVMNRRALRALAHAILRALGDE